MDRRTLLKALVASAFASRAAYAAPPANMKGIEQLQKDWKTFLPAGATVPSGSGVFAKFRFFLYSSSAI